VRPWLASAGAVAAGFLVTAVASTAADAVMHDAGLFPSSPRVMSDPLFALASAYRALFTVAGGYATARLAPDRPMRHVWILAGIGLVTGLVRDLDPHRGHPLRLAGRPTGARTSILRTRIRDGFVDLSGSVGSDQCIRLSSRRAGAAGGLVV
jgi:hypothetical protein